MHKYSPLIKSFLIQQRSSQLVLVVSQLVKWRSPECSECVSSDGSIKTRHSLELMAPITAWRQTITPDNSLKRLLKSLSQGMDTKTAPSHWTSPRVQHTTTVAWVLHQSKLYGRMAKRKLIKSPLEFTQRHVGDSKVNWLFGLMRPRWNVLTWIQNNNEFSKI